MVHMVIVVTKNNIWSNFRQDTGLGSDFSFGQKKDGILSRYEPQALSGPVVTSYVLT